NVKGIIEGIDKKEETAHTDVLPTTINTATVQPITPESPVQQGFSSVVSKNISSLGAMPSYASFFQNKAADSPEEPEAN
ncbi:hypothetical protein ABTK13_23540, partial [Acinetobacter baumannii]